MNTTYQEPDLIHEEQIDEQPFFKIPIEAARLARKERLTAAQYTLWLFLLELDPYGSRFVEIPNQSQLARELGLTRQTVHAASARLQEIGLYDFQVEKWYGRNPYGAKSKKYVDRGNNVTPIDRKARTPEASSEPDRLPEDASPPQPAPCSPPPVPLTEAPKPLEPEPLPQTQGDSFEQPSLLIPPPPEPELPEVRYFDPRVVDWQAYENAGDFGSDPGFWEWAVDKTRAWDSKQRSKGKEGAGDIEAYALAIIRNGGPEKYWKFLKETGQGDQIPESVMQATAPRQSSQPQPEALQCGAGRQVATSSSEDVTQYYANLAQEAFERGDSQGITLALKELWNLGLCIETSTLLEEHPEWGVVASQNGFFKASPIDVTDTIVEIQAHLKRLNWGRHTEKKILAELFGKEGLTRDALSITELATYLKYLKGRETS